jgi:hypothetical protein
MNEELVASLMYDFIAISYSSCSFLYIS